MNKILNLLLIVGALALSQGASAARVIQNPQPLTLAQVNQMKSVFANAAEMQDITSTFELLSSYFKYGVKTDTDTNSKENPVFDALFKCFLMIRPYLKAALQDSSSNIIREIKCPEDVESFRNELHVAISRKRSSLGGRELFDWEKENLIQEISKNFSNSNHNQAKLTQELDQLDQEFSEKPSSQTDEYNERRTKLIDAAMCREITVNNKSKNSKKSYFYNGKDENDRSAILASFDALLKAIKDSSGTKNENESDTGKQATSSVKPSASATSSVRPSASAKPSESPTATKTPTPTATPKVVKSYKDLSNEELTRIGNTKPSKRTAEEASLYDEYKKDVRAGVQSSTVTKTPTPTATPKVVKSYKDLSNEELTRIGNTKPSKRTAEEQALYNQYNEARRAGAL